TYSPRDAGLIVVGASLQRDPEAAERAILRELFRLAHEDVTSDELSKARPIIDSDAVYQKETVQGMARKLGYYETVAGGVEYEQEYFRQVQQLSPEKIREAVGRYLTTSNMTLAILVPQKDAPVAAELKKQLLT